MSKKNVLSNVLFQAADYSSFNDDPENRTISSISSLFDDSDTDDYIDDIEDTPRISVEGPEDYISHDTDDTK
jgi:hypothetical protein